MYEKTTWEAQTPISPSRLNNIETQYDSVVSYWEQNPFRLLNTILVSEVLTSAPTASDSRVYFNSTNNTLYVYNGASWVNVMEDL